MRWRKCLFFPSSTEKGVKEYDEGLRAKNGCETHWKRDGLRREGIKKCKWNDGRDFFLFKVKEMREGISSIRKSYHDEQTNQPRQESADYDFEKKRALMSMSSAARKKLQSQLCGGEKFPPHSVWVMEKKSFFPLWWEREHLRLIFGAAFLPPLANS